MCKAKGLITAAELRAEVEGLETLGACAQGARVVARAWTDAAFKAQLLRDGTEAVAQLGISVEGGACLQ